MILNSKYRMVIGGVLYRFFDNEPTDEQMIEVVQKIFPTFMIEGEPVKWLIEKYYWVDCPHINNETIPIVGTDETITICHDCGEEI